METTEIFERLKTLQNILVQKYDLEAILYKGDEIVGTMKYQIENEDEMYSVVSAELVK